MQHKHLGFEKFSLFPDYFEISHEFSCNMLPKILDVQKNDLSDYFVIICLLLCNRSRGFMINLIK